MRPSSSTGTNDEMIAPTPPLANLASQLTRVCDSEPSSLSQRPELLERKTRFLTVRLRNLSGVKIGSPAGGFGIGSTTGSLMHVSPLLRRQWRPPPWRAEAPPP